MNKRLTTRAYSGVAATENPRAGFALTDDMLVCCTCCRSLILSLEVHINIPFPRKPSLTAYRLTRGGKSYHYATTPFYNRTSHFDISINRQAGVLWLPEAGAGGIWCACVTDSVGVAGLGFCHYGSGNDGTSFETYYRSQEVLALKLLQGDSPSSIRTRPCRAGLHITILSQDFQSSMFQDHGIQLLYLISYY
jgi:hypothetical protein